MKHLLAILFICLVSHSAYAERRDPSQHFFQQMLGDLRSEAGELATQKKVGVVLMFEIEDCPFCDRMHNSILSDSRVQDLYRAKFGLFRIDMNSTNPVVDLAGRDTTEKALASGLKIRGTPTTVFFDLQGKELTRYVGPSKDVAEFLMLADYVLGGQYQTQRFTDYKAKHAGSRQ